MATNHDVLVLDGDKIAALDVVRSYGRRGLSVAVAAVDDSALAFHSRFARTREIYPDPRARQDEFLEWVRFRLERSPVKLVVPVTDLTTLPLAAHGADLRRYAAIAAAPYDALQIASDKHRTIELARTLDIPTPATTVVSSLEDLARLRPRFPVVCKPLRSTVWDDAGFHATSVWYAFDQRQFVATAASVVGVCPLLVQEFVPGFGTGIEVLADAGAVLEMFQHRRLHEVPLTGGGSTYRISEALDPVLALHTAALMRALRWTGVAMVEFRIDERSRTPILMEINGRFWGSLPLSSRAGASFANGLYDLLVPGQGPVQRPQRAHRAGVRCRKLAEDIDWFKERFTLAADDPRVRAGLIAPLARRALWRDLLRVAAPWQHFDVQVWWDPVPGAVDASRVLRSQAGMVKRRLAAVGRRIRTRWSRATSRRPLLAAGAQARRVLFVCHGNIMRSAFAAAYFEWRARMDGSAVQADSAGVHAWHGRPADPRAATAGRAFGLDLSAHRSKPIDAAQVDAADLILVMDRDNLHGVLERFPGAASKTFLLGVLDQGPTDEIADPFSHGPEQMQQACGRIVQAIEVLAAVSRHGRMSARRETLFGPAHGG